MDKENLDELECAFEELLKFHGLKHKRIASIEQNCGSIQVTMMGGKEFALSLMDTE